MPHNSGCVCFLAQDRTFGLKEWLMRDGWGGAGVPFMKEYCSCSSQLVAGPSSLGSGALPYLIFSQVAALQNGQLLLQGLQFPHLSGKVLLVLFPHGIFQEPGTKVGVWHVTKVGLPSVGGALRARVEWAEKSKAPQCCAQGPLKETSDGLGELGEGKGKEGRQCSIYRGEVRPNSCRQYPAWGLFPRLTLATRLP